MRGSSVKRTVKWLGAGLAGAGAFLGLCWVTLMAADYWRVERAIARFETNPSPAGVDVLVALIESRVPTARQGERMLERLLKPTVVTRTAYPVGRHPTIALELPFTVPFQNASLARDEQVLSRGNPPRSSQSTAADVVQGVPRFHVLSPPPRRPETWQVQVRQRYTLNLHHAEHTWSWHPLSGPFPRCLLPYRTTTQTEFRSLDQWDYACAIVVQAEIVAVEPSEAETIELVSDPSLDQAMKAAFSSQAIPMGTWYQTARGKLQSMNALVILYHDLPAAVGFEPTLRLSDGREISADARISHRLYARAGSSGQFTVSPSTLRFDEPGSYEGSILLRSDPNQAYRDPAIKAIWDGTLEFPISFTVSEAPNRR